MSNLDKSLQTKNKVLKDKKAEEIRQTSGRLSLKEQRSENSKCTQIRTSPTETPQKSKLKSKSRET